MFLVWDWSSLILLPFKENQFSFGIECNSDSKIWSFIDFWGDKLLMLTLFLFGNTKDASILPFNRVNLFYTGVLIIKQWALTSRSFFHLSLSQPWIYFLCFLFIWIDFFFEICSVNFGYSQSTLYIKSKPLVKIHSLHCNKIVFS